MKECENCQQRKQMTKRRLLREGFNATGIESPGKYIYWTQRLRETGVAFTKSPLLIKREAGQALELKKENDKYITGVEAFWAFTFSK